VVVRRYARWWAHPLSTDVWLTRHRLQPGEIPRKMRLPSH
jgi:hypothetical protein